MKRDNYDNYIDFAPSSISPDMMIDFIFSSTGFPEQMRPILTPILQPVITEMMKNIRDIEIAANSRLQQKFDADPSLDKEAEMATMGMRMMKKLMEQAMHIIPEALSNDVVNSFEKDSKSLVEREKVLQSVEKDLERIEKDLPNIMPEIMQKGMITAAKMLGFNEEQEFYEKQYKNKNSNASQLVDFLSSRMVPQVAQVPIDTIQEVINKLGSAEKYIRQSVLNRVKIGSDMSDCNEKIEVLSVYINDDDSNVSQVICNTAKALNVLLEEKKADHLELESFFCEARYNTHKALEEDAPGCFPDEASLLGKDELSTCYFTMNRYFTKWSEQNHNDHMQIEHSNSKTL